jgi:hypothetical protein
MKFSLNNKLFLQPYEHEQGLKTEIRGGLAFAKQRVAVKGLRVLIDARVSVGNDHMYIPAGSIAYVPENLLVSQPWAKDIRTSDLCEEKFFICETSNVVAFDVPDDRDSEDEEDADFSGIEYSLVANVKDKSQDEKAEKGPLE